MSQTEPSSAEPSSNTTLPSEAAQLDATSSLSASDAWQEDSETTDSEATDSEATDSLAIANWGQRPEAVVLLVFVSIFMIWQLYLDLMEEAAPGGTLSARKLAQRLEVNQSTISRRKEREDFTEWTQRLDPDGIAWAYVDGAFCPKLS